MNILVVDDDAMVVESCRRILGAEGMGVESAPDAAAALALLDTPGRHFDLLITDIKMPGQDGFSLLSRVKERRPGLAVLIMTGYLVGETRRQAETLRAGCLSKPFTPEELITAVTSAAAPYNPDTEETPHA